MSHLNTNIDELNRKSLDCKLEIMGSIFDELSNPVTYKNMDLIYVYCNKAFCNDFEVDKSDVIGHAVHDFAPKEFSNTHKRLDLELLDTKKAVKFTSNWVTLSGKTFSVLVEKHLVLSTDGIPEGILSISTDMSEYEKIETLLIKSNRAKDLMLEISNAVIEKSNILDLYNMIFDSVLSAMDSGNFGTLIVLEDGYLKIVCQKGYLEDEIQSFSIKLEESYQWKSTGGRITKPIIINNLPNFPGDTIKGKLLKNELDAEVMSIISAPIIIDGELFGFINIDSTEYDAFTSDDSYIIEYVSQQIVNAIKKFRLYESIKYVSDHDSQTDLFNRRYFESAFEKVISRSNRYNETFLLVAIDLDNLKIINDSFGHIAGDYVINKFAKAMKASFRNSDIISRTGGDEFSVITFYSDISEIAEKLDLINLELNSSPVIYDNQKITMKFSYGIAKFGDDGKTYDQIVKVADSRMYEQKKAKKNVF